MIKRPRRRKQTWSNMIQNLGMKFDWASSQQPRGSKYRVRKRKLWNRSHPVLLWLGDALLMFNLAVVALILLVIVIFVLYFIKSIAGIDIFPDDHFPNMIDRMLP